MFYNRTNSPVVKNFRQGGLLLSSALQDLFLKQPKHCIKHNKGGVEILPSEGAVDSYNNTINLWPSKI